MRTDTATGNDHLYAHIGQDLMAADGTVYRWVDHRDHPWGGHWAAPDGSSMNNAAVFAGTGVDALALRAVRVRTARIDRLAVGTTLATVQALLPDNYAAVHDGEAIVVTGADVAGWTLDGYVLPRLRSALIAAEEITATP